MNPFQVIPPNVRRWLYLAYGVAGLVPTAVGAWFLAVGDPVPRWCVGMAAALGTLAPVFGATAGSNVATRIRQRRMGVVKDESGHARIGVALAAVSVILLAIALVGALAFTSSPTVGHQHGAGVTGYIPTLLKVKCDEGTRNGQDVAVYVDDIDPIVNHNEPQSMHQHDFFGASGWQATAGSAATYDDLRASSTRCRIPGDTAGYWAPSLVYTSGDRAGERVPVQQFTAYYRGFAGQTTHSGSQAFPPDVRLVAQQWQPQSFGLNGWTCGAFSTVTGGQPTIPDCSGEDGTPGNTLTAHINFPSCWNGNPPAHTPDEVGDTRDNADWAYPTNKKACPADFPIEVIQLRETIQYAYTGDGSDVALASDMGAAPGSTMHVDFLNAWDQAALERLVRDCVQTKAEPSCDP